jgi:RNA recognition motif-containing protein
VVTGSATMAFATGGRVKKTFYVGNLASHADPREVEALLSNVGKVLHFKVMADDDIMRRHGGFAIVEMEHESDAIRAVRTLHGTHLKGNKLEVRLATAAEETAAGHPRMFGSMNMDDDPVPPRNG